jgi:hypothetical protein
MEEKLENLKKEAKEKIIQAIRTNLLHGDVNDADLSAQDTESAVIFKLIDRCETSSEIDELLHVL